MFLILEQDSRNQFFVWYWFPGQERVQATNINSTPDWRLLPASLSEYNSTPPQEGEECSPESHHFTRLTAECPACVSEILAEVEVSGCFSGLASNP